MNLFRLANFVCILIAFALIENISHADDHSNARGKGMSNASTVSSFGVNAYGINPANFEYHQNIDLSTRQIRLKERNGIPAWEVSVLAVGGSYGSDQSMSFYNNYLSYLSINRQTFTGIFTDLGSVLNFRQNILPDKQTQVNYDLEVRWLSVNYTNPKIGALNFTVADKVGLNTDSYSKDQEMPFTFHINVYNGKYDLADININQAEATAWWIRKYSVAYSRQIDFSPHSLIRSISLGTSVGLVHGFGNIITYNTSLFISTYGIIRNPVSGVNHVDSIIGYQDFHSRQSLTDLFQDYRDGTHKPISMFPRPAGKGYSIDLGFNMQIGNDWRFAMSVTDLGSITWNYNAIVNDDTNHFSYYNFDLSANDPTYNTFINDLDGIPTRITNTTYKTDMPTKYRAGLMYKPSDDFTAEMDFQKGKNNLPGNSMLSVISAGMEYYINSFIPVRCGISAGGPGDFYVALGTGIRLKNLTIDFATGGINQIFLDKRLSLSLTTKVNL